MKKEWEVPVILEVNSLPEALGVCADGTTGTSPEGCKNGFDATGLPCVAGNFAAS